MHKFSVKKPLTVFVAVIAVLVLGVVAYLKMTPDLLPNMDFPYVIVVTTYPGASPEKVEEEISKPMEQAMSTLEHIKQVTSTSSENVSTVMMEFEEAVNMDTIGVDIQQQIVSLSGSWGDMVGTPYVLKINPSMLPVEVAAVSKEGMDTIQLTEFLNDELMNALEGIPGVARISTTGMVQQELHVVLDQKLIDKANAKIADAINGKLDETAQELKNQKQQLEDSKQELEDAKAQMSAGVDAMLAGEKQLQTQKNKLLDAQEELETAYVTLTATYSTLKALDDQVNAALSRQESAQARVDTLQGLKNSQTELATLNLKIELLRAEISSLMESEDPDQQLSLQQKQEELNALEAEQAQKKASYEAGLLAAGVTEETLDAELVSANASLTEANQVVSAVDQVLASQGMDRAALSAAVAETESQLAQVKRGKEQLEAGLLSIEDAAAMLEEQKLKGMMEMSSAAGQMAAGASSIDMGLSQIDSGLEQLEEGREDALKQADLHEIITMEMVSQILMAQNFAMPAGYVSDGDVNYMVSVGEEITELQTLKDLLLFDMGMEGVDPIYLADVAVISLTDNRDETYAKLDGLDGVILSFEKQSTYATAETTSNIAERFRELEAEHPGLKFVSLMDQGDYIYLVVESILKNLFLGALFSVLILFIFLRDIRPTFITLCSIPISVIFAIVLMYFSGVSLNMISLSGLAIAVGMLVDNSVVVIENIYRLRAKGANVIQAAVSGAGQVIGAVTASTLTTVCVFVPIVFVEGLTRQLFTDLALTMTYALMASLIVSLTLVPAMATGMLRKDRPIKETSMGAWFNRFYRKTMEFSLRFKPVVLIVAVAALAITAVFSISKGFVFMPTMDSPNVTVTVTMPEGSTMDDARGYADEVQARIAQVDGIATVGATMSSESILSLGMSTTGYNVTIYVTLEEDTMSGAVVSREIVDKCQDLPCGVSATSAMMDISMLTGSGVSVNVYADDMAQLQESAQKVADIIDGIDGVDTVSSGLEDAAPALHVDIDRNEAMKHGLTVAQVYMELAEGLTKDGTVASLNLDGISTDVIIEKPKGAVLDAKALREYVFEVTDREGETKEVPLSDFAVVEETSSLSTINRIDQRRYLTVTATLKEGFNVTLLTARAEAALAKEDFPKGVSYAFTGENEMIMESMEQLLLMLLMGILLVYLIMVAQFQSLKSPFIVMFTIPLAFTGGFGALLLCGLEISIIAMIGFVMLVGIIVNNGIVLVDYINQLRIGGMERKEAIIEAGITRVRPILMTTLTTVLGQIVMAVSKDVGSILMRPIAVVSIGGLLYATLMTLYVVPVIYDMMNKKELYTVSDADLELLDM